LKGLGLVRAGGQQRTDSTHVLAAVRGLNRLELAGESMRAALEALAAAVPGWLAGVIDGSWQQVYGQRIDNLRLPAGETARTKPAEQYGRDGYHLLEAVRAAGAPGWLRELPAVRALRVIWVQQYYRVTGERGEKVIRGGAGGGSKPRLGKPCPEPEPDGTRPAPNLITSVATTEATVPDAAMTEPVH